jgi:hypothetical protein
MRPIIYSGPDKRHVEHVVPLSSDEGREIARGMEHAENTNALCEGFVKHHILVHRKAA